MPIDTEPTPPAERVLKSQREWWEKRRREREKLRKAEAEKIVDKLFREKVEKKRMGGIHG